MLTCAVRGASCSEIMRPEFVFPIVRVHEQSTRPPTKRSTTSVIVIGFVSSIEMFHRSCPGEHRERFEP